MDARGVARLAGDSAVRRRHRRLRFSVPSAYADPSRMDRIFLGYRGRISRTHHDLPQDRRETRLALGKTEGLIGNTGPRRFPEKQTDAE